MKRSLVVIIILFFSGVCYSADHGWTNLPLTADGWTDVLTMYQDGSKYTDARIIYVSTSGNNGTGTNYSPGAGVVGDDPFNPTGAILPYQTLAAGYAELRNGYSDLMLLKRGDNWSENMPTWKKSGESPSERMIIGAYGTVASARPIIDAFTTSYGVTDPGDTFSDVLFLSIEFEAFNAEIGGDDILIEDCAALKGLNSGFVLQGLGVAFNNLALRRCVISERYPAVGNPSHCQGIYTKTVNGLLLEENVFYHNGWTADTGEGGQATMHNHNTYMSADNNDTIMRYNISAAASSKGYQPGGGGTILGNLSVEDEIGIQSSRDDENHTDLTSVIQDNVILNGNSTYSTIEWGIWVNNTISTSVKDNIIANTISGSSGLGIILDPNIRHEVQMYVKNVTVEGNIIHNWGRGIWIIGPYLENVIITNNKIHDAVYDDECIYHYFFDTSDVVTSSGNLFYSSDVADNWFYCAGGGGASTFAQWQTYVGDTTSTTGQTTPSGSYDIPAYLTSIGETATLAAFYTEIKAQRKGSWDDRYMAVPIIDFVRDKFGMDPIGDGVTIITIGGSQTITLGGSQTLTIQ